MAKRKQPEPAPEQQKRGEGMTSRLQATCRPSTLESVRRAAADRSGARGKTSDGEIIRTAVEEWLKRNGYEV